MLASFFLCWLQNSETVFIKDSITSTSISSFNRYLYIFYIPYICVKLTKDMRIPLQVSLVLRYLHQEKGESLKRLQEMYPQFKKTTLYRHMKKPLNDTATKEPRKKTGRPCKVTDCLRGARCCNKKNQL